VRYNYYTSRHYYYRRYNYYTSIHYYYRR
jgi:hypothetical protein